MITGIRPIVNEVDLIKSLETSLNGSENPPKVPSFLLGIRGTLLIGLAVLRKKDKTKKPGWKIFIQS